MKTPFFTTDWMGPIHNTWPQFLFPLLDRTHPINWLEVGSFEGRSAIWIAENLFDHPASKIYCVDKWDVYPIPSLLAGYDYESVFDENIRLFPQILKRKGSSGDVLPTFEKGQFHGCYIDASHEKDDVLRDARLALPLVRKGGVIVFDDYEWPEGDGVKKAVTQLFDEWKNEVDVVHIGYQVIFQVW